MVWSWQVHRAPAGVVAVAVATVATAVLAGCGAGRPPLAGPPPTGEPPPRPVGVRDPASAPSPDGVESCEPRASLRPATVAGDAVRRIRARGRLIAGVSQNAHPMAFPDPASGDLVGFEIDLVRQIARDLLGSPDRVQFVALGAADRIPSITNGSVDMVIRTMTMTCRDWQQVAFSTEYYTAAQRLLVPRDSGVTTIEDLAGHKVCAAAGSTSITNLARYAGVIPVAANEVIDCLVMLQQHQIDAVSTSDVLLAGLAAQDPTTIVVGPAIKSQPYGIAIAPTATDLVRFVNHVLQRLRQDGTWQAIHRRWLSSLGPTPTPPPARYRN
jgi:polar amino acid transport system substrate-binding protein